MAQDFSAYLSVDMDSVPKSIPSVPLGHFFATIKSWKTAERNFDKATGGPPTPVVELTFQITAADSDVDESDPGFAACIGKTGTKDYRLNDADKAGIVMLRRLAEETCKLPVAGLGLEDVLNELKGAEVKVYNEPRAGQEEGQFFPNFKKILPAD